MSVFLTWGLTGAIVIGTLAMGPVFVLGVLGLPMSRHRLSRTPDAGHTPNHFGLDLADTVGGRQLVARYGRSPAAIVAPRLLQASRSPLVGVPRTVTSSWAADHPETRGDSVNGAGSSPTVSSLPCNEQAEMPAGGRNPGPGSRCTEEVLQGPQTCSRCWPAFPKM